MPEVIHYVVTQTRQVRVAANNEIDAARIAGAAFENGQNVENGPEGIWGNTLGPIKVRDLHVIKEN